MFTSSFYDWFRGKICSERSTISTQRNNKVFRIRGIPAGLSKEDTAIAIQQATSCGENNDVTVSSLCQNVLVREEQIATCTFTWTPDSLVHLDGKRSSVDVHNKDGQVLKFDEHFQGLTPLSSPSRADWQIDVVALSGLNGHAFGSFKSRQDSYMWLRDGLCCDCPQARVFIWGYDTRLVHSSSFQSIIDLGRTLKDILRCAKLGEERPLILIGHSLGGIVLKAAVNLLAESQLMVDNTIFQSLSGIFLFGVPNQGMHIESLVPMVGSQPNRSLLDTLGPNSPVLQQQAEVFTQKVMSRSLEVISFYETLMSPTAAQNAHGRWGMTGPSTMLVTPDSATHGKPSEIGHHHVHAINRTHSEMVKFVGRLDETYLVFKDHLCRIRDECRCNIGHRQRYSAREQECLRSLSFCDQEKREHQLQPARNTCDWLLDHPKFKDWLRKPISLFWIRGKPGSGKSMLMKHIVTHLRNHSAVDTLILSFFIHGQGTQLQKSLLGLYRALLHQVYLISPESFLNLTKEYEKRNATRSDWTWDLEEVEGFLISGLTEVCQRFSVVVIVDALDETGEAQAVRNVHQFERLAEEVKAEPKARLRICFSCRHYPEIKHPNMISIAVEDHNGRDISTVTKDALQSMRVRADEKELLQEQISDNAHGIFQWAYLVTEKAIRLRKKGKTPQTVISKFQEGPTDLFQLYESLLDEVEEEDRAQTTKLLRWLMFSGRPLSRGEIQHALALDTRKRQVCLKQLQENENFSEEADVESMVRNLSKGLAEVKSDTSEQVVQFIHQSVLDYLLGGGLASFERQDPASSTIRAHAMICRSCIKYLQFQDFEPPLFQWSSAFLIDKYPFVAYAWVFWAMHAIKAIPEEQEEVSLGEANLPEWPVDSSKLALWKWMSNALELPSHISQAVSLWQRQRNLIVSVAGGQTYDLWIENRLATVLAYPQGGRTPTHFLASTGTQNLLHRVLPKDVNKQDHLGYTPLHCALVARNDNNIKILLASGADANLESLEGITPFHLAAVWGRHDILQDLLEAGASDNAKTEKAMSPLYLAVCAKNPGAVELLIKRRASANTSNGSEDNVLLNVAIKHGDEDIVDLLLHYGSKPDFSFVEQALVKGQYGIAKALLNAGASPKAKAMGDIPILVYAALHKHHCMILPLLQHGAEPDSPHPLGWTMLHWAANKNEQEVVGWLLSAGANTECRDYNGETAIFRAAENGNVEVASLLADHGADVNSRSHLHHTPLFSAVRYGGSAIVARLIDSGANPGAQDRQGLTALARVVWEPPKPWWFESNVKVLHMLKPTVNIRDTRGRSPLFYAVLNGYRNAAKHLLDIGVDPRITDNEGLNAMAAAVLGPGEYYSCEDMYLDGKRYSWRVEETLLRHDNYIRRFRDKMLKFLSKETGNSLRGNALLFQHDRVAQPIDEHVLRGEDINSTDDRGYTPLMTAVESGQQNSVWFLLMRREIDVTRRDRKGRNVLHHAILQDSDRTLSILLCLGQFHRADLNMADTENDATPLMVATYMGSTPCVKILLSVEDVDVDRVNGSGSTALRLAVFTERVEVVQSLLESGRVNLLRTQYRRPDRQGMTPLLWAIYRNCPEIVRLLLDFGSYDASELTEAYQKGLSWSFESVDCKDGSMARKLDKNKAKVVGEIARSWTRGSWKTMKEPRSEFVMRQVWRWRTGVEQKSKERIRESQRISNNAER